MRSGGHRLAHDLRSSADSSFTLEDMPAGNAAASTVELVVDMARPPCCSLYHRAVELIGKRWTGAILSVLMEGPLRFSEIRHLVPDLSDRLLSERLKELEGEGIVAREAESDNCSTVRYGLTPKGQALEPAVRALKSWARDHLEAGDHL
jgi:DNA-binding HxlR family transcriptional regulator